MNESLEEIELLSTMLPKPTKKHKEVKKKAPSKLALKKTLRRSSMYDKLIHSVQNSKLVTLEGTHSEDSSDTGPSANNSVKDVNLKGMIVNDSLEMQKNKDLEVEASVIVIESTSEDESENNDDDKVDIIPGTAENSRELGNKHFSSTKYESVKNWVNKIDVADHADNLKLAVNSTFALDKTCLPFDEWIKDTYNNDRKAEKATTGTKNHDENKENHQVKQDKKEMLKQKVKEASDDILKEKTGQIKALEAKPERDMNKKLKDCSDTNARLAIFDEIEKRKARNDFLFDQLKQKVTESAKKKEINSYLKMHLNNLDEYEEIEDNDKKTNGNTPQDILTTPNITKRKQRIKKVDIDADFSRKQNVFVTPAKQIISNNDEISNLLDQFYGNSWHKNKDEILSERKPTKKINMNRLRAPQTETKNSTKDFFYQNPYLDSERAKSKSLLKDLHKKRIDAKETSPFFARPKYVDDDTPSPSPGNDNTKKIEENLCLVKSGNVSQSNSDSEDNYVKIKTKSKKTLPKPVHLKFSDVPTPSTNKQPTTKTTYRQIQPQPRFSSESDPDFTPSVSRNRKTSSSSKSSSTSDSNPKHHRTKSNSKSDEVVSTDIDNKKTLYRRIQINSSGTDTDFNTPAITKTSSSSTSSTDSNPKRQTRKCITSPDDIANKLQNVTLDDSSVSSSDDEVFLRPHPLIKSKSPKELSFLSSLSKNIPDDKCNPSALIYKNNFKTHRDALTKKLFDLFNEKIFDKCIPEDTPIQWSARMTGTAGFCSCMKKTHRNGNITRCVRLQLSTKVLDSADRLRDTLVHEMCHAATFIVNQISDGHGSFWKSWACKAMKAFPELPPIKRCHDYDINYKFTYKCMSCNYSFGRHSKSLNLEKKRCGYCYGRFEVLLNKTSRSGDKKSVPCTPKKVSGFAKYVKDNYALHKSPGVSHADLMKFLGKKFQEQKCSTV